MTGPRTDGLDALRRLDFHRSEHHQLVGGGVAGTAAKSLTPYRFVRQYRSTCCGGREPAGLDPGPQDHQRNAIPLRSQELGPKLKAQGWKQVAPQRGGK